MYRIEGWLKNVWRSRLIITNAKDLVMVLDSSTVKILESEIKLEGTWPTHNNRFTKWLHISTYKINGVIPPEKNSFRFGRGWPFDWFQNQFANRNDDIYHRNGPTGTPMRETWQNMGTNPRSRSGLRQDPQPSQQHQPARSSTPNNSVFRRCNSQESSRFVPCEKQFPQTNDQHSSHAVRLTKTDDSNIELSDLCLLNWWVLRSLAPVVQAIEDLASNFSPSPETLKKIVDCKSNSCWIQELPVESSTIEHFGRYHNSNTL